MEATTNPSDGSGERDVVLVTGGSGYLAQHVIVHALDAGFRVRTTLRNTSREGEVRAAVARASDRSDELEFARADLTEDAGWHDAVDGCRYVLHVASPFPAVQPKDPNELIVPAREGALRVLRAAKDVGVERCVLTSSVAAIDWPNRTRAERKLTEDDWTDGQSRRNSPYARSKTIAEQTAWAFAEENALDGWLASVNPGAILGPTLTDDHSTSLQLVARLLDGERAIPRLGYNVVDVRDVAALHLLAATHPDAAGRRYIAVSEFLWMEQIARLLRESLGDQAAAVPTRVAPNALIRLLGLVDGSVRSITGQLGVKDEYSNARARETLGWQPRPVEETVIDTARSLIE